MKITIKGKKYRLTKAELQRPARGRALMAKGYLPSRYRLEEENGKVVTAIKKLPRQGGAWEIEFHGGWIEEFTGNVTLRSCEHKDVDSTGYALFEPEMLVDDLVSADLEEIEARVLTKCFDCKRRDPCWNGPKPLCPKTATGRGDTDDD